MNFGGLLMGACTVLLATALGAAGVLGFRTMGRHCYASFIAFCAGAMGFSAIEMISQSHALSGHRVAGISLLTGMLAILVLDKLLPHMHTVLTGTEMPTAKRKVAVLVGTITIHNIPEGFAIASAFATSSSLGWLVTLSVALQDIPEGLIVAAPVACYGVSTKRSFLWGVFSGVVEFFAAIAGFLFLRAASGLTPYALGFSGGAMVYVVLAHLLPDAMQAESRYAALAAFITGIAVAYGLSVVFGL
jgi:zinc transporter, ZIP family